MIRMVFFDIDGTLTDFDTHRIPDHVFVVLRRLKEQGIKLIIATGRGKDGLSVLEQFPFDGYITLNGQYCFDENGTVLYENTIDPASIRQLLEELKRNPVPCGFQLEHERIFNFRNELVDEIHAITGNDDAPAGDISGIEYKGIYQCMIFMDEEGERRLLSKIPNCRSARWYPTFFDLSPEGGTKVRGMELFMRHYGISREETVAFGDGGNDLEMIRFAGIGVAMGNAGESLKDAADYVTETTANHGIEQALSRYGVLKQEKNT